MSAGKISSSRLSAALLTDGGRNNMPGSDRQILGKKDNELSFPQAMLISASAGSGKTYTLAHRCVQFFLSDRVPGNSFPSLLAVTFTNNAAKEMKARVVETLKALALKDERALADVSELLCADPGAVPGMAASVLEKLIDNYSDFHIQTIDSFLTRIVKASCAELGLAPDVGVVMSDSSFIDGAVRKFLSGNDTGVLKAGINGFLEVVNSGGGTGSYIWNPFDAVRDVFGSFYKEQSRTGQDFGEIREDVKGKEKSAEKAVLDYCSSLTEGYTNKATSFFNPAPLKCLRAGDLAGAAEKVGGENVFFSAREYKKNPELKEHAAYLLHELGVWAEMKALGFYLPYVNFYSLFYSGIRKKSSSSPDSIYLGDVPGMLSEYIKSNTIPDIYLSLGERINHFLIDEFQDTSRLQWNVFRLLIEEALSKRGSLFLVGDVKQAIYMFRNADYKIMSSMLNSPDDAGGLLSTASLENKLECQDLPNNYRCDEEILRYSESIFKEKLPAFRELFPDDPTKLTKSRQSAVNPGGYVRTKILTLQKGEEDEVMDAAYGEIAAAVKDIAGRYSYKDIAVLVPKKKYIEPIINCLNGHKIKATSFSSLIIFRRKVGAELMSLLKFLAVPSDNLSLAAFLKGSVFASVSKMKRTQTDDFLFEFASSGKEKLLYVFMKEHPDTAPLWNSFFEDIFRKTGYLQLYELVSLIFRTFRVFENFPSEHSCLVRFLQAVADSSSNEKNSLETFIEWAEDIDEDSEAVFSVPLPKFTDAVRIMTYYKAKGLGFDAVINFIPSGKDPNKNIFFSSEDGGEKTYRISKKNCLLSGKLKSIYDGYKRDENIQKLNSLYVILTRAKHEMHNIVVRGASPAQTIPWLFDEYESGSGPARRAEAKQIYPESCVTVPSGKDLRIVEPKKPAFGGFKERAEGELVHGVLAAYVYSEDPDSEIDTLLKKFARDYRFDLDFAAVKKRLTDILKNKTVSGYFKPLPGRTMSAEEEICMPNGGVIRPDRIVVDREAVTVIDFKNGKEHGDQYRAQLRGYMRALSGIYGRSVRGMLVYLDGGSLEELRGEIRQDNLFDL